MMTAPLWSYARQHACSLGSMLWDMAEVFLASVNLPLYGAVILSPGFKTES